MAEGPLVHRMARELGGALKGKRVDVEFGPKAPGALKPLEPSLRGVRLMDVEAFGKQFRFVFADGRTLLVHLMMWGWWRVYRRGEPWDRPADRARVVVRSRDREAVAFSAPVVRLFGKGELVRDKTWGDLGPDPLRKDFSAAEFRRRLRRKPSRTIGEALLDQRVISGIGNIVKIELLFGARVHPRRTVASLTPQELGRVLAWTRKLMTKWLKERGNEDEWIRIYRGSSKPCPRCGERVEHFTQGGRTTYACAGCQPLRKARGRVGRK
ncbi:MAG: DNA-formamidopyrimidine glycosylase family protein [bacterium]